MAAAVYGGKANWPEAALRSIPGASTCKRRLEDGAAADLSLALQTCSELGVVHERQELAGNKYMKASITVGISFEVRLSVSKPVLKAPTISALEAVIC
jgi:hypothetical protein